MIETLRLVVVAENDVAREGIMSILEAATDFGVVAALAYADDLVAEIARVAPQVVVVDHSPPEGDGIRLCRSLRDAGVEVGVVVLVDEPDFDVEREALSAGARLCLARNAPSDRLTAAVRAAASDSPAISALVGTRDVPGLARSQLAVLRLLVEGKSVNQIAEAMGLSPHTVRSYLRQIYRRLGVTTRAEAAAVALRRRLV